MKAYKDKNGNIRLFRPDMNMARMNRSTARIALPVSESERMAGKGAIFCFAY
jgi:branched-chain amino acid aminotransferase